MQRFHFHLRSGEQIITDDEGMELPDIIAARQEACTSARHIVADAIRSGIDDIPKEFVISDGDGRELETLLLAAVLPKGLQDEIQQRRSSTGRLTHGPRRAASAGKRH
jgi:hypothetical protein